MRYAGGWISLDERDLLQRQILTTGFYEPEVWDALSSFVGPNEVLWDVGAHVGSFSVRAMLDARIEEIHAFEPDPLNRAQLLINTRLNGNNCSVHPYALSNSDRPQTLYHGPNANTGLSSLAVQCSTQEFQVACCSADDLIFRQGLRPATVMKVDVEGWESNVFAGAERLLSETPPKAIAFETACGPLGDILDDSIMLNFRRHGYSVSRIERPSGVIDSRENYLAKRMNAQ